MNNANFFARRILSGDINDILRLSTQICADYSYLSTDTIYDIQQLGEGWCATQREEIVCVGGFIPLAGESELCIAAQKTGIFSRNSLLVLPVAAMQDFSAKDRFFEWCLSRASAKSEVLFALLPVKSGLNQLALYFSMGLALISMRPLYALRPYYIFVRGGIQTKREGAIMVDSEDTFSISRFLDNGYCAVDLNYIGNEIKLILVKNNFTT